MANQEFEEFQYAVRQAWQRYRGFIVIAVILMLVIWIAGSSYYTVGPDSRGVVLRFGEPKEPTTPGLHFKMPWPVDVVYTVPVEKVQSIEFGYRTVSAGRRTVYAQESESDRTLARMLTADLNLAHVEWVVQYRIKDADKYLFKIGGEARSTPARNARDLIGDVSEAIMRQIIGDVSVDSVITTGREKIASDAKAKMQTMLDGFESGIKVVAVKLQTASPPEPVKDAFDAVNRAKQAKEKRVNEAKGERNAKIPAARGKKDRAIAEAEGYALRVVMEAEGHANAFLAKLKEYNVAPEITRVRLYLEAMEKVFSNVPDKTVIDESIKGMLPLLHLNADGDGVAHAGSARNSRRGGAR